VRDETRQPVNVWDNRASCGFDPKVLPTHKSVYPLQLSQSTRPMEYIRTWKVCLPTKQRSNELSPVSNRSRFQPIVVNSPNRRPHFKMRNLWGILIAVLAASVAAWPIHDSAVVARNYVDPNDRESSSFKLYILINHF
jgi:hypothetical protein